MDMRKMMVGAVGLCLWGATVASAGVNVNVNANIGAPPPPPVPSVGVRVGTPAPPPTVVVVEKHDNGKHLGHSKKKHNKKKN
jgi:hypothetical protein